MSIYERLLKNKLSGIGIPETEFDSAGLVYKLINRIYEQAEENKLLSSENAVLKAYINKDILSNLRDGGYVK